MNVVYIANDNYAAFLGISMYSLLYNNQNMKIKVYALSNNISESNLKKISHIAKKFNQELIIIDISNFEEKFNFNIDTHGYNITNLSRLFLENFLPQDVEKVLYLDCDIIIDGNIEKYWNTDISSYELAGTPEFMMPLKKQRELGLKDGDIYCNAGVLLINLKKWREVNKSKKFLEFYASRNGDLQFLDQDIINYCCKGKILIVGVEYNFSPNLRYFPAKSVKKIQPLYVGDNINEYKKKIKQPLIIHFLGEERPWIRGNWNSCRRIYEKYEEMSPWKKVPRIRGQELYMQGYHILNLITRIIPIFRVAFTHTIGINKINWFGKKN